MRGRRPSLQQTIWRWLDEIHQRNQSLSHHTMEQRARLLAPYVKAFVEECGGKIPEHLLAKPKRKKPQPKEPKVFVTFEQARNALPKCIYAGFDPVGQHRTLDDLKFMAQTALDLYDEGESEREVRTKAQYNQVKRYMERIIT